MRKTLGRNDEIIEGKEVPPVEHIYNRCPKPFRNVPSVGSGLLSSEVAII